MYKEFVQILIKLHCNFHVKDISQTGDTLFEGYLKELYQFSVQSYKAPINKIKSYASRLNQLWHRVYYEAWAIQVSCQSQLEDIIKQLTQI